MKQMAPQFVRDYVKHVTPTHWRREKKKELDEKQQSFSPAQQVHFSSLSLHATLWLNNHKKQISVWANRYYF